MQYRGYKKKILDKLTIILTTHNSRYGFIFRCLDNFEKEYGCYNLQIVITDSGDISGFNILKNEIIKKKYNLKIQFIHFLSQKVDLLRKRDAYGQTLYEYSNRLLDALKLVHTEYSVIAADDDFYFPNYFIKSLIFLEKNHDYASVYGHMLKFKLDKFKPYGKINDLWISEDNNPPNPWLESDMPEQRLINLGKNPWSWFSWYAVQKTYLLKLTINEAVKYKIDGYLFEKFVSFCHAALYKSKKIDFIYCGRQENNDHPDHGREPFSYKRNKVQLNNFIEACTSFLIKYKKIKVNQSRNIVLNIIKKDFILYKQNDNKEFLRYLKKKFQPISAIQKKFFKPKINTLLDNRLVMLKNLNFIKKEAKYIKDIVESNSTT